MQHRTATPIWLWWGSIKRGLAQLEADGVIINRLLGDGHNFARLHLFSVGPSDLVLDE